MATAYRISCPSRQLRGKVELERSKSISNRALIIRSLCTSPFEIHHLSTSDDTDALITMLSDTDHVLYSGHAGSSYRFMVARACLYDHEVTLNASEQLRRRPIGPLVNALRTLGAEISYLNKEGFPPLKISPSASFGKKGNVVTLQAGVSSQYITALLLIAPMLPDGLILNLSGQMVSSSYIQMTLAMMAYFDVQHTWVGQTITIPHGAYVPKDFIVEGDWSAASYFYTLVAFAEQAEVHLKGLQRESIQGDAVVSQMFESLGVETRFDEEGITLLRKNPTERPKSFEYDFTSCPDLAQTIMVALAGIGMKGRLSGLRTLRIKETDRLAAMQTELARVKTHVGVEEKDEDIIAHVAGKAKWKDRGKFETYEDHRMAMALSALGCLNPVIIKDPLVVSKSYPRFWEDIESIGMKLEKVKSK